MGVFRRGTDGGELAKVDSAAVAHDGLAVPSGANSDRVFFGIERNEDATEGLERGPSMNRGIFGN